MKQIQFKKGEPIALLGAVKSRQLVQGNYRDCLELTFPEEVGYEGLRAVFSDEESLSELRILEDGVVAGTHLDYQLPRNLALQREVGEPGQPPQNRYVMTLAALSPGELLQRAQGEKIARLTRELAATQQGLARLLLREESGERNI